MNELSMKKIFYEALIFYFLFLLPGCQARISQSVVEPPKNPTNTAVAAPERKVSEPPLTPTTMLTFIPSPSPSPSATSEPSIIQKDCYSLQPSFPKITNLHGVLILGYEPRYKFIDWETGNTTEIAPQKRYSEMVVSPDRKKIAYHDNQNNQVVVMTQDNKILRKIPWDTSWTFLSRWQNNETLLIGTRELLKSVAPNPAQVIIMVDTGTGQSRKMIPDYPHITQGYPMHWSSGSTVFDPMLTRVVYAQTIGENDNYTLWDIPGKRELIALKAWTEEEPVWSIDGSSFIVFTKNHILSLVSRNGIALDTIDFQKTIYHGENASYPVSDFSYSPDGNQIAFWVRVDGLIGKAGSYHLMILNTTRGKIADTCLEQEDYQPGRLIWAPNGDQVAAPVNYRAGDNTWDVVIADVAEKYAVKIEERLFPIGWLEKTP